jgi:putative membrane protein
MELLKNYLRGILMGTADVVPGVSGGTMALIVGIYERLVAAVSHFFRIAVHIARPARMMRDLREVDWRLLLPLGAGIVTALLIGARFIPYYLDTYPEQSRGFFFGLILASIAIPWLRLEKRTPALLLIILVAGITAFVLVGLPPRQIPDPGYLRIMLSASVAICAMILPGVSGAFLLLVLGIYEPTLRALDGRDLLYVGTFIGGALLGLGLFSRLLTFLLARYHDVTMAALVGLMAGSLRALWPWLGEDRELLTPAPGDPFGGVILLLAIGFVLIAGITWWGHRRVEEAARPN